jgi:hypothetical protein
MHSAVDPIRAARRFGAFAVLTLRAIDKVRRGELTGPETAAHFDRLAHAHGLRKTGAYDGKLVDTLIARLRQARKEERPTWGEGD